MPADVRNRILTDVHAITTDPAFRGKVATAGSAARTGTSAQFAAAIEDQRNKIAAIHKTIPNPAR
jgi:tripartite-type tricarboxylate transporter receptor subunit TctC